MHTCALRLAGISGVLIARDNRGTEGRKALISQPWGVGAGLWLCWRSPILLPGKPDLSFALHPQCPLYLGTRGCRLVVRCSRTTLASKVGRTGLGLSQQLPASHQKTDSPLVPLFLSRQQASCYSSCPQGLTDPSIARGG